VKHKRNYCNAHSLVMKDQFAAIISSDPWNCSPRV
jgi:hypothetical protein